MFLLLLTLSINFEIKKNKIYIYLKKNKMIYDQVVQSITQSAGTGRIRKTGVPEEI